MNRMAKLCWSMFFKIIIVICVFTGFSLAWLYGHVNGPTNLLYFTNQSNLALAIFDVVVIIYIIKGLLTRQYRLSNAIYQAQQVLTLCITITGLVYCFLLVPSFYLSDVTVPDSYTPFNPAAVLLHMVVPILAVLDFFLFTRTAKFKKIDCLYSLIPTGYYFIFALIGYLFKWDFGDGRNYPYFFLNYGSPAGIFGTSDVMPYFMGSFYWIVIILVLVLLISYLYIYLINLTILRYKRKYKTL